LTAILTGTRPIPIGIIPVATQISDSLTVKYFGSTARKQCIGKIAKKLRKLAKTTLYLFINWQNDK